MARSRVASLVAGLALVAAGGGGATAAILDEAHYNADNGEPDAAVWVRQGDLSPLWLADVGLLVTDPDNSASVLYVHEAHSFAGTAEATITARVRIQPVDDGSSAWSNNQVGFQLILDDGVRRAVLILTRDGGTNQRQVRLANSPAGPLPFPWDNDQLNTYSLARLADGRIRLTVTNGDIAAPVPTQSKTFQLGELPPSHGTPLFAWGSGAVGGSYAIWREVDAGVTSSCTTTPNTILSPIDAAGTSSFRLGRTIPVKIAVTGRDGGLAAGLAPQVALSRIGAADSSVNEVVASSSADSGTTMRFDASAGQYVFNLSTKSSQFNSGQDLTEGRYRLTITEPSFCSQVVAEFDLTH